MHGMTKLIFVMLNTAHVIYHLKITSMQLLHINVGHPEQIHKMLLDFVALSLILVHCKLFTYYIEAFCFA